MKSTCLVKVNNRIGMQLVGFQPTSLTLVKDKLYYNFHDAGEVKNGSYHLFLDLETGDIYERLGFSDVRFTLRLFYDAVFTYNDYSRTGSPYGRYRLYKEANPEMTDDDLIFMLMEDEFQHLRREEIEFWDVYSDEFRSHILNNVVGKEHYEMQVTRLAAKLEREKKK